MEAGELHAEFDDRKVTHGFGELDEMALALLQQSTITRGRIRLS
jgi:hypothetical protein